MKAAASARLCVETVFRLFGDGGCTQPPPRGCVLKPVQSKKTIAEPGAAASARLCVETSRNSFPPCYVLAAASARLCVETSRTGATK